MRYTYYKFDASKLTLAELWRSCNNVVEFLIATVCKGIGVNVAPAFGMARTDRLVRFACSALPAFARSRMEPLAEEAQSLGLVPAFCFTVPTVGALEGYSRSLRSKDGQIVMGIDYVRISMNNVANEKATFYFLSQLRDGSYLITSGSKREENAPANQDREHHPGRPMAEVLQRHRERLAEHAMTVQTIDDDEQLERLMFRYEREIMDYQIERGAFVALPENEVQRLGSVPRISTSATPQETGTKPKPLLQGVEWICWLALLFGIYLFARGDANHAQFVFRLALVSIGLLGVIAFQIARLARTRS
jgi:hypothetical protein